ncbi:Arsenate reductase thioredoxin-coupled, LMWP family [hydrothermal vent metagenome]|uniref:Arsenate reductase thioredoxin-coupled, LMWP family n=1 Tax=hydrothermal vent metagenome TaxID=652676 RepID=A0A3B1BR56_9ZZZZ
MKLLFLCTGNACRSQMAEGWARALASNDFEVYSAGIEAHGLNPRAVAVMRQANVDISRQESTRLSDSMLEQMDYVVTVCGHADELCPALPPGVRKEHWPLTDPAKAEGSEEDIMQVFRHSRDDIKQRVQKLLERLTKESDA